MKIKSVQVQKIIRFLSKLRKKVKVTNTRNKIKPKQKVLSTAKLFIRSDLKMFSRLLAKSSEEVKKGIKYKSEPFITIAIFFRKYPIIFNKRNIPYSRKYYYVTNNLAHI